MIKKFLSFIVLLSIGGLALIFWFQSSIYGSLVSLYQGLEKQDIAKVQKTPSSKFSEYWANHGTNESTNSR